MIDFLENILYDFVSRAAVQLSLHAAQRNADDIAMVQF
jgi:hypothetical protein